MEVITMGIIFDNNAPEKEIYEAYGMTVYGKENNYDWTIYPDKPMEKCYISLRITNTIDGKENEIINITLGNRCVFKENFDRTIDNFLYWISKDSPFNDAIENAVFKVLTCTDSIFNHRMEQRKWKERKEEEERKQIEERKKKDQDSIVEITDYCTKHGFLLCKKHGEIFILKSLHKDIKEMIKNAIDNCNTKIIETYIDFAMKHPENKDLRIVINGMIEEVLEFVRK